MPTGNRDTMVAKTFVFHWSTHRSDTYSGVKADNIWYAILKIESVTNIHVLNVLESQKKSRSQSWHIDALDEEGHLISFLLWKDGEVWSDAQKDGNGKLLY